MARWATKFCGMITTEVVRWPLFWSQMICFWRQSTSLRIIWIWGPILEHPGGVAHSHSGGGHACSHGELLLIALCVIAMDLHFLSGWAVTPFSQFRFGDFFLLLFLDEWFEYSKMKIKIKRKLTKIKNWPFGQFLIDFYSN